MSLTYDVLKDDVRAGRPIDFGFVTYVPERACRNLDVRGDRGFECSSCGYEAETYGDSLCNPDDFEFCPMCGARVEVER